MPPRMEEAGVGGASRAEGVSPKRELPAAVLASAFHRRQATVRRECGTGDVSGALKAWTQAARRDPVPSGAIPSTKRTPARSSGTRWSHRHYAPATAPSRWMRVYTGRVDAFADHAGEGLL